MFTATLPAAPPAAPPADAITTPWPPRLAVAAKIQAASGRTRSYAALDVSLLGLAWPFAAVEPGGERMRATVAALEGRPEIHALEPLPGAATGELAILDKQRTDPVAIIVTMTPVNPSTPTSDV